ncbi:DNA_polymerase epsilon [Hexamita inflata]|uniref:DNA polymerase epsilon catalytic subunit n=1 Tax=Hexamita inflata TaxID=28002 RepID=A0AA86PJG1_9EUKA|nr:DNA polymerase epsilon [Hexamita inflata]
MKQQQSTELHKQLETIDRADAQFGVLRLKEPGEHIGYMYNMHESFIIRYGEEQPTSALECYFVRQNLTSFKIKIVYQPYLLINCPEQNQPQISLFLEKNNIQIETTYREDSSVLNHVAGQKTTFLKLTFKNRLQIQEFLKHFVNNRGQRILSNDLPQIMKTDQRILDFKDLINYINKVAESDVPDHLRIAIDKNIRCAKWYRVKIQPGSIDLEQIPEMKLAPKMRVLAFDIETSKQPLCFPNALQGDQVMCISYMVDGRGVLLVNRQIFAKPIEDFEYSPTPQMTGKFKIFNSMNEREMLLLFIEQIKQISPHIIVTYNGDSFDFKFIHTRCQVIGIDFDSLGFTTNLTKSRFGQSQTEYTHSCIIHIDCLRWVMRDSYLPQGSQGLKSVTKAKLKYQPTELDPELMTPYAKQKPQILAEYSVSDAVATYYLYKKFIESFILALCNIIPLNPDSVLRKGTGTLCESLLCVEATEVHLVYPEKISNNSLQKAPIDLVDKKDLALKEKIKTNISGCNCFELEDIEEIRLKDIGTQLSKEQQKQADMRILISQTYAGGRVEAINSGIYRHDFDYNFFTHQNAQQGYSQLIDQLDQDLEYFIYASNKEKVDLIHTENDEYDNTHNFYPKTKVQYFISTQITNYQEIKNEIQTMLLDLQAKAKQPTMMKPIIYHLDVSAMYPNIILTNRLQPHAVVDDNFCNNCDYNFKSSNCKRRMTWLWRGIYYPCTNQEFQMIEQQLQSEKTWQNLSDFDRQEKMKAALDIFCQKSYKARSKTVEQLRESTICQRENPFFVDTVRNFRNRRYVYKAGQKAADNKAAELENLYQATQNQQEKQQIQDEFLMQKGLAVYNESLQLAHKAILNSFYGYAMRAGSRWFSMQMAACVTFVGSQIIRKARALVELIGIPLELDTDGIWCMLPADFPAEFHLKYVNGKKGKVEYPAVMLNAMTAQHFSNEQYSNRIGTTHSFNTKPECSIEFEIDGPYKGMFLSAAKEEGKKIKKRYCVFDLSGKISELKGFELKRRGELQLIKSYQQRIFIKYLDGKNIEECYSSVAKISDQYLSIIKNKGVGYDRKLILELLEESTTMKNSLNDTAPNKKGAAITCAKRLSKFLDEVFATVVSLTTKFVISKQPVHLPVSERAIPIQIFDCSEEVQQTFLKQWTQSDKLDLNDLLDWDYYETRFVNCLMKLVVVPAGLQGVKHSPIQRVPYPEWLQKTSGRQLSLDEMMNALKNMEESDDEDKGKKSKNKKNEDDDASNEEPSQENENLNEELNKELDEKQTEENTVEQVMNKHGITVNDADLKLLYNVSKNQVKRSDGAPWLEQQIKKWKFLAISDDLSKSIVQMQRESYYNRSGSVQKRIGNDIYSQLQNRLKSAKYIVLSADLFKPGVLRVLMLNIQSRQQVETYIQISKKLLVNHAQQDFQLDEQCQIQQSLIRSLPNSQKAQFTFDVEVSFEHFKQNKKFFDSEFANPQVLGVYHSQITEFERFVLELGSVIELSQKGAAELDYKKIDFKNCSPLQQTGYLFDGTSMRCPVSFAISLQLAQGNVLLAVRANEFHIWSGFEELDEGAAISIHEQYKSRLQLLLQDNGQNVERVLLKKIVSLYTGEKMVFRAHSNPLEQFLSDFEPFEVVFVAQELPLKVQVKDKLVVQVPCYVFNDSTFVDILLETIANFAQLEQLCAISKVPIYQMVNSQQIYGVQQSPSLVSIDFALGRQLTKNKHALWLSHTNRPDFGKDAVAVEHSVQIQSITKPQFCRGITVFFELKNVYAHAISSCDKPRFMHSVRQLITQLLDSTVLLDFIEEYVQNKQSLFYSQQLNNTVSKQVNSFLNELINLTAHQDIKPVHMDAHSLVLMTDKLSEQLAVNKLSQFLKQFEVKIVKFNVRYQTQLLFYTDVNNYFGISTGNTVVHASQFKNLMPEGYYHQAISTLACYLMFIKQYIEEITPCIVSLHQLESSKMASIEIFNKVKGKLLGIVPDEEYQRNPLNLLLQTPNITQLRALTEFTSQLKQVLAPQVSSGWIYIKYLLSTIGLDNDVEDECQTLYNGLVPLFIQLNKRNTAEIKNIAPLYISEFCPRCNMYIHMNLTQEINLNLNCTCNHLFKREHVEQLVIEQIQEMFNSKTAEIKYLFKDYLDVFALYNFKCVINQIEILLDMI